ncbi:urease accessory protein UreD [Xanthobacter agilis]|uniref:Urease accessory protein UreD n=1 Tax=Xanthobacter agilis TaxID=47492 RepID=A0ABU0LD44_XANAG|nr:urease accessory protein UreD [Xanthobacter agilis]MDQ0505077.1 urease accessory protein [Xanthobacter agilis]
METTCAASWPSEAGRPAPRRQRSEGRVHVAAAVFGSVSRLSDLAESGALRARLPRGAEGVEAVVVNTAGGVACGDLFRISATAGAGAHLTLTTPAAEKVYRSDGAVSRIEVSLSAGAGARLEWLPQETILFDRARLARHYAVELDPAATFLSFEALVLGRLAHGDAMGEGHLEDHWRVRRAGRLVYADALRLSGPIGALLARPAVAAGHRALGTLLYVAPDAEGRLDEARALLEGAGCACGASAWNGLLAVRWLAADSAALRRAAGAFLIGFRGTPLPRVWAT